MSHRQSSLMVVGFVLAAGRPAGAEPQGAAGSLSLSSPAARIAPDESPGLAAPAAPAALAPDKEGTRRLSEATPLTRVGVLAGVGAPSLLSLGVAGRVGRFVGVGADFGFIPEVTLSLYGQAKLSYQQYDAYLRVFPAGGGFFVGSGLGYMKVKASLTRSYDIPEISGVVAAQQLEFSQSGSVRSMVLTPKAGYQASLGAGFLFSFELGAQIPVSSSDVELSTSVPAQVAAYAAQYTPQAEAQVRESLRKVGQQVVPTLALRLGWMF